MMPTMTLHELAEAFRANLVPVSEAKLGQMIVEGKFPFSIGTQGNEKTFMIFRAAFYEWLGGMIKEKPVEL